MFFVTIRFKNYDFLTSLVLLNSLDMDRLFQNPFIYVKNITNEVSIYVFKIKHDLKNILLCFLLQSDLRITTF